MSGRLRMLGICLLVCVILGLVMCSREVDDAALEVTSSQQQRLERDFVPKEAEQSQIEYLREALQWAEGKTLDEMVEILARSDIDSARGEVDYVAFWRRRVVEFAFIDTYGASGAEQMRDAFLSASSTAMMAWAKDQSLWYDNPLDAYPEIATLALRDPLAALARVDGLQILPRDAATLRVKVLLVYGEQHPQAALALVQQTTNVKRSEVILPILKQVGATDPAAALAYIDAMPRSAITSRYRNDLLVSLVNTHPLLALESAIHLPVTGRSNAILREVTAAYLKQDPEAGYEWLLSQVDVEPVMFEAGFQAFRYTDPEKAAALFALADPSLWDSSDAKGIAEYYASKNMDAALEWARADGLGAFRTDALTGIFSVMGKDDPQRLVQYLQQMPAMGISSKQFAVISAAFASEHPDVALNWVQSAPDSPATASLFGQAANRILQQDPSRIGEILGYIEEGSYKSQEIDVVIEGWADANFDSAIGWVQANSARPDLEQIVAAVAEQWVEDEPASALQFARSLPPGAVRDELLTAYTEEHCKRNLPEVVNLLCTLPATNDSRWALWSAFRNATVNQPELAKQLALGIEDSAIRDKAVSGVAVGLAEVNLEFAADWLISNPIEDPEIQKNAAYNLMERWRNTNLVGAANWVTQLPSSGLKTAAAKAIAGDVAEDDLPLSQVLLQGMEAGRMREDALMGIIRMLPDSASRDGYLGVLSLSNEERTAVQERRAQFDL